MREKRLTIFIDKQKSSKIGILQLPIDKTGLITSISSEDAFPSLNLSAKIWNFLLMRIKIKLMLYDEC